VSLPDVTVNLPPRPGELLPQILQVSGKPSVTMVPYLDIYDAGFDRCGSWTFGGKRRRLESAGASVDAAYAGYDDLMVSLPPKWRERTSQVRTLQRRLAVSRRIVAEMKDFQEDMILKLRGNERREEVIGLAGNFAVQPAIGIDCGSRGFSANESSEAVVDLGRQTIQGGTAMGKHATVVLAILGVVVSLAGAGSALGEQASRRSIPKRTEVIQRWNEAAGA